MKVCLILVAVAVRQEWKVGVYTFFVLDAAGMVCSFSDSLFDKHVFLELLIHKILLRCTLFGNVSGSMIRPLRVDIRLRGRR